MATANELAEAWRRRAALSTDEACDLANSYLLDVKLESGYRRGIDELKLARAQWLVLWALLRARDEAVDE
jgi:hypothetical protein